MKAIYRIVSLAFIFVVVGCASPARDTRAISTARIERQLVVELAHYGEALGQMDYDQVANFFVESGEVTHSGGEPVRGRESIRKFLKSFAEFKVLEYVIRAESTVVEGATAKQTGFFSQTVVIPNGNTVRVRGLFEASWIQGSNGRWNLARMQTAPDK